MPISILDSTKTVSSTSGTSANIDCPSGSPAVGVRVVAYVAFNQNVTIGSTPTGWVLQHNSVDTNCRLLVYYNVTSSAATPLALTWTTTSDWAAIAVAYEGVHYHGISTISNYSDVQASAGQTEAGTDTTILTTAAGQYYSAQGAVRVGGFAQIGASAGWTCAVTSGGGTISQVNTEAQSSAVAATAVSLAMFADSDHAPRTTSWTWTGTAASASDRVCIVYNHRPQGGVVQYQGRSAASSSAGTSGSVTVDGQTGSSIGWVSVIVAACDQSAATFSFADPSIVFADSFTSGNLHVELWLSRRDPEQGTDGSFTISQSANWTVTNAQWQNAVNSDDKNILFKAWQWDQDTASDTQITTTSLTASRYGQNLGIATSATGASQTIGSTSSTWNSSTNGLISAVSGVQSSGSPRIAATHAQLRGILDSGESGTVTINVGVATTEKVVLTYLINPEVPFQPPVLQNQTSVSNIASRW